MNEFCTYFHCLCTETATWELPVKTLNPGICPATSISYKTDAFPLPSDVYGIYSVFLCDYVAWPCDVESVSCTKLLKTDSQTNFLSYNYRLLTYELLNLITFPLSGAVTAHVPCYITYQQGEQKWSTFL